MRKSLKREYELKHTYDFADFDTQAGRDFTKKSSHRRVRRSLDKNAQKLAEQYVAERQASAELVGKNIDY